MDQPTALRLAQECFHDTSITTVNMRSKARLWAGMGDIYQVDIVAAKGSTRQPNEVSSLIVKYIHPRFAKNVKLSRGDQRKWDSYHVEANFYEHYAQNLIDKGGVPLPPPPYRVERRGDGATIIICMGALNDAPLGCNFHQQNRGVMNWLAKFHAATWGKSCDGWMQSIGSYWHLDTRPTEWEDIPRNGWEGRLKMAARAIDNRLKRDKLQCWIHGDAKDANILSTRDGEIAFCDFQYCGAGPPSKDLAYYLCTTDAGEQQAMLDIYYEELCRHLSNQSVTPLPTKSQLNDSVELAFCDFCRFMAGWGYWGCDISVQVRKTLDKLDGGKKLKSEAEYEKAVSRLFG